MTDATNPGEIEAANAYESLFVPALFRQWTTTMANAAQIQSGQRVLDVACGTGILAREIALRFGAERDVAGIDPSEGMIAVAKELAPDVEWRLGVAESLPFSDESFEVVVSQFGLMFFTDRHQAIREMLRVLTPRGRLVVAVLDSLESMPAYTTAVELLETEAGREAADALRAPFVLGNKEELLTLFSSAGATSITIDTHHGTARFPSIRVMMEAELRGWLPLMGVMLSEKQIAQILLTSEDSLSAYSTTDGAMIFPLSVHVIAATKGE